MKKPRVLICGKKPPPFIGPAHATEVILKSELKDKFDLIHLDTSDHRNIDTLGAFDFWNFYLAFRHYLMLCWIIMTKWPSLVYMPISQTTVGYFRDAGFILIAKLFKRKLICHLRGGNFKNWYDSLHGVTKFLVRRIHSRVDAQIVLGEKLHSIFLDVIAKEKIFVVPNGGNYVIPDKNQGPSSVSNILYLANFIRSKGILDVLHAVPEVYKKHPDVRFTFIGAYQDQLVKNEVEAFLDDNPELPIEIKGPVFGRAKYQHLADADIFVFPTYYPPEGHPWVIVEAMAAGLPIISTDQGAIIESVIDGENGFIIEKRSPHRLAERLNHLLENPGLALDMGQESRRLYGEKFTEEKMAQGMIEVFNHILN